MSTQPPRFSTGHACAKPAQLLLCAAFVLQCACLHSSDYFLHRGNQLFAKGDYAEACLNFRKATQKDAGSAEAYFRLGTCEYAIQQKDNALAALIEAHRLDGKRQDILGELADATFARYLQSNKSPKLYRSVQALVAELLAANPESVTGLRLRGDMLLANGKLDDAIAEYEKANRLQSGDAAIALPLADALAKRGKGEQAEQIARAALTGNPHFGPLYVWLSHFYNVKGRGFQGQQILQTYAQANPSDLNAVATFAVDRFEHQRFPDAKPYLQRALQSSRQSDRYAVIGDLYVVCQDPVDADSTYRAGLQIDPAHKTLYRLRLAKLYLAWNKADEALRVLDENLTASAADLDSALLRVSILESTGRQSVALTEAKKLLSQHPDDPGVSALLGNLYYRSGDSNSAKPQFLSALKQQPNNPEALSGMVQLSRDAHDYPQMLVYARELAAIRPGDARVRLLLASALARAGDAEHAETELKALVADPSVAEPSRIELALLYVSRGDGKSAISLLQPICSGGTRTDRAVLSVLASAYIAAGESEAGLNFFSNLLPVRQEDGTDVRYLVGQLAERAGKNAVAEQQYSLLIKDHPETPLFLTAMGALLQAEGETQRAIPLLRRAAVLAPDDPGLATLIAEAYQSAGDRQEAITAYAKAAKLAPSDPVVLNNYAYLLATTGEDPRQAIALAKTALSLRPNDPDLSDTLGFAYLKAGDNAAASSMLDMLVKRFPERAAFRYHLALALSADGKGRAARQHLMTGLANHPSREEERDIRQLLTKIGS